MPLTPLEQIYASFVTLVSKTYLAFLYAEVSNLISSFYSAYIEHVSKTSLIVDWLKYNNCDYKIIERVVKYRNILWHKCKGIDDQGLLTSMPETLRKEVKMHLLEHLVQNTDVIPKDDAGPVVSIVERLDIRLFPRGEFIIREGEIALVMYLLIEGVVDICGAEGKRICRLTPGKCFGEMALQKDYAKKELKEHAQTRMASAICITNVSVAVFDIKDFTTICACYPEFKLKVAEIVHAREKHNNIAAAQEKEKEKEKDEPANTVRPLEKHVKEAKGKSSGETPTKFGLANKETVASGKRGSSTTFANMLESRTIYDDEFVEDRNRQSRDEMSTGAFLLLILRTCVCLYNIYFIPLQMAFRFEYTAAIYSIEAGIMLLHAADIAGWINKYRKYTRMVFAEDAEEGISVAEKRHTPSTVATKKRRIMRMIILECFTFLPWSMLLQTVYYPTYVLFFVKMIRALKIWPAKKLLSVLKRRWVNAIRICEVLALYIIIAHVMACSYILMMYVADTRNESWVKRVPYPQTDMYGFRTGNDMTGVSNWDIYCHALYFAYIIFTHISIGDICAVNLNERIVMCVYIVFSIHFYAFLFANITSMVTDLARGLLSNLETRYEMALKCTKAETLPADLVSRIKAYFDFLWVDTRGIDDTFLAELPVSLTTDIYLQIYQHAIENCILFRKPSGEFDRSAATSFIKMITIRKYMKGDILTKAGSLNPEIYFLLEGEVMLLGINLEKIGTISPGLIFGAKTRSAMEGERSLAHLVVTKISTLAVVPQQTLDLFLEVFPHTKGSFEQGNEKLYGKCKDALKAYADSLYPPANPTDLLEAVFLSLSANFY